VERGVAWCWWWRVQAESGGEADSGLASVVGWSEVCEVAEKGRIGFQRGVDEFIKQLVRCGASCSISFPIVGCTRCCVVECGWAEAAEAISGQARVEQGVPSNGSQQVFSTCYRSVWAFWCFLHFFKVLCGAVWWIRSRVFRATAVSGSSQPVTGQCGRFGASNVSEVLCGTVWWGGSGRVFQATAASGSSQPASGHCGRFGAFNVPFWCCAVLCGGAMWGASSVYSVQGSGAVWCSVVEGEERNGSSSLQPSSGRRVSESATSNFNRSVSSKTQIRECTGRGG
ncbi:unnamed protein product, partial [Closterium sp. NIES-54]